ncbi:MAG: hypothetical protein K1X72_27960 [Pyrinomonadaceae bacterium]|nr:hypothetical protein [Pyrinomonadaceae bacterium]
MKYIIVMSKLLTICLVSVTVLSAQRFRDDKIDKRKISTEERVVRFAYKKLYIYSLAGRLSANNIRVSADNVRKRIPDNDVVANSLKFELTNFQFGNLEQIKAIQFTNLVTPYLGDVIDIGSNEAIVKNSINKTQKYYFSLSPRWNIGRFATLVDNKMTLGEIINYVPTEYNGYETFAA